MEKFKSWAIGIGIGWALLAFIIWHHESECGILFSRGCFPFYWSAVKAFMLLTWLYHYQTLCAGLAAIFGGVFVLEAAKLTARDQQKARGERDRKNALIACSLIIDEFRDAMPWLQQPCAPPSNGNYFSKTPLFLPTLYAIHPVLGSVVSSTTQDAKRMLDTGNPIGDISLDRRRIRVAGEVYAIYYLLLYVSKNLTEDGFFDMERVHFVPGAQLKQSLEDIGASARLVSLRDFFYLGLKWFIASPLLHPRL